MSQTCGEPYPANLDLTCDKVAHPFGAHMHRASGTVWDGVPMPVRTKKGQSRVGDIAGAVGPIIRVGPPRLGPPPAAEAHWALTQAEWLVEAKEALREVCRAFERFTNDAVWALVDSPKEKRAMVQVTKHGIKAGWMVEDGGVRVTGTWRTRDGVEFPLNKIVPIYRSLVFTK